MSGFKEKFNQFFAMEDDVDYDQVENTSGSETYQQTNDVTQADVPTQKPTHSHSSQKVRDNLYALPKNANVQVSVVEPRFYSEVETVGDLLLSQHIVVLNLQRADNNQGVRMIDFLNGVVFSIKGDIKRVGENIFVCTPPNVTLDGMDNNQRSTRE